LVLLFIHLLFLPLFGSQQGAKRKREEKGGTTRVRAKEEKM
jgi:hypothetical protein